MHDKPPDLQEMTAERLRRKIFRSLVYYQAILEHFAAKQMRRGDFTSIGIKSTRRSPLLRVSMN